MGLSVRPLIPRIAVACLALVTALVVAGDLARLHSAAARAGTTTVVVFATRDLPVGHRIALRDVTRRSVPVDQVPSRAAIAPRDIVGWVARVPILRDTPLSRRHITRAALLLRPSQRMVTISVEQPPPLAPGDRVDVYRTGDELRGEPSAIVAATDATVRRARPGPRQWTVTLVVRDDEVSDVVAANGAGTVQLVLAAASSG